jgi:hypothetical protein
MLRITSPLWLGSIKPPFPKKHTKLIYKKKKGDFCGRFRHFENIKEYYTDR